MYGVAKDPQGDSQAGAADTDIVGNLTHGSMYTAFDDNSTTSPLDDTLLFRIRIDNPTALDRFAGVIVVGIDANNDGRIDIFISVDGRSNGQVVRILEPGTGLNISPNTTTTSPLPVGWLPNNGIYPFTGVNYSVVPITQQTDSHWDGVWDIGGDGNADVFVSWRVSMTDLATVLAKPSPVDRNGIYGPRGPAGIAGFDQNTPVRYVSFTQTQTGPINGDLNGVGASYDRNATFQSLGAATALMSPASPISDGPRLTITKPISGGSLSAGEGASFSVSGTSSQLEGQTVTVTVSDGSVSTSGTATIQPGGNWSVTGLNVSGLTATTLTVTAAAQGSSDSTTVLYDKTGPTLTINPLEGPTTGFPTLSGNTDLPVGSIITIAIDRDNNGSTDLTYQVAVSGGVWTLDTATIPPSTGVMPATGLTSYAKITVSGTDAVGNTTTLTSLNRPTVNALTTNDTTPVLSGTWTRLEGDTLTVTLGGATFTLSPAGNLWTVDTETAPKTGTIGSLGVGGHDVTVTVTRSGNSVTDATSGELTINATPVVVVTIDGGETSSGTDTTPSISGTSQNAGGFVVVRIDPNNDGLLNDAVTYSVSTGGGAWSLDTGATSPISGTRPAGGFTGINGILVTDSSGAVSESQVLTISVPTVGISSITSAAASDSYGQVDNEGTAANWLNMTEDNSVTITGTATGGLPVDLKVSDPNGNYVSVNNLPVTGSSWSATGLNLSSLDNGTLTVVATLSGTLISAESTAVTHDKTAPVIYITAQSPVKKSAAVVTGKSDLPANTVLVVEIWEATMLARWSNVPVGASGYFTATGTPSTGTDNIGNGGPFTARAYAASTALDTAKNITQLATKSLSGAPNASAQSITISAITGDNIILVSEIGSGVVISGTTTAAGTGNVTVTVTDGSTSIVNSSVPYASLAWNWTLTPAQVQSLRNGQLTITASVVDNSVNPAVTVSDVAFATLSLATPVLTLYDNQPSTATGPVTFTFGFSEPVTGFDAGDISISTGTKGAFNSSSASSYTLVVNLPANTSGNLVVSVAANAGTGTSTGRGCSSASNTQPFDTTETAAAPILTIDSTSLGTDSTPLITGDNSLPAGSPVVVRFDFDNDGVNDLSYSVIVQGDGTWSLDVGTATPVYGTLPEAGIPTTAKVTATSANALGVSTTVVGLNRPTVDIVTRNSSRPLVTGTWTQVDGDVLTVTLQGVTYSVANGNLFVGPTTWSCTPDAGHALGDGTYGVVATVTRSAEAVVTDPSNNELTVDTVASVSFAGGLATDLTGDPTPVISGSSTGLPVGSVLTLDLNLATGHVIFKTAIATDGSWSIDTTTATPTSGALPGSGLTGPILLTASATDPAGNVGTANQTLTVDVTPPVLSLTFNSRTTDATPVITGAADLPAGSSITVKVDADNDGNYDEEPPLAATVQSDGSWAVVVTTTLTGTVGIQASGSDEMGNTTTVQKSLTITEVAPSVTISEPLSPDPSGKLTATTDDAVTVQGSSSAVPAGSTMAVTITDGSTTLSDTATVGSGGAWTLAPFNLSSLANATISVTATYLDDFGSAYSDTATVIHDKSGAVTVDAVSEDSGTPGDFITSDTTPAFSGSASPGTSVHLVLTAPDASEVFAVDVTANGAGTWSYAYSGSGLTVGTYQLGTAETGSPPEDFVYQAVVIDDAPPTGPVSVNLASVEDTTPTLTGQATLGSGETLSVTIDGFTYTVGDGYLTLVETAWALAIPPARALTPKSVGTGFNGVYEVVVTLRDTAGNLRTDETINELTVADTTAPVIDLDPTATGVGDGSGVNFSVRNAAGIAVSLDDNADPATVVETSDMLGVLQVSVAGLLDAISEKLIFGTTMVSATGSSGPQPDITVGGVRVNLTYSGSTFTLQKYNYSSFTAAEAQAILRDLKYLNTAAPPHEGTRTFTLSTGDDAGNLSANAVISVEVVMGAQPPVPPVTPLSFTRITTMSLKIRKADVLAAWSDPNGDPLTITSLGASQQGATITANDTFIFYVPAAGNNQNDSFNCTVSDGQGGSTTASIQVVVDVNAYGSIRAIAYNSGGVELKLAGIPGFTYRVQRASDSAFTQNVTQSDPISFPETGVVTYTDASPPDPMGYYRLKWTAP
jgi:hypothetical protein